MFAYQKTENTSVFKSYLRLLLRDLKDLNQSLDGKDYCKAEKITSNLVEDTQKGIEDN